MNLTKLKYIVEIADSGSITNAAKKLFVSQPYLSKVVADFEKQFNKQIFIRTVNGLKLSDDGHKVYLLAQSIIQQMELLDQLGSESIVEEKDTQLSFSVGNLILKDNLLLNYLQISHVSRNDVDFYETTISGCIDHVENDISEFAVIVVDEYQKSLLMNIASRKGLEYIELDEGYPYFHLHRDHPLAHQEKISIDSLKQYPIVRFKNDDFTALSNEKFKQENSKVRFSKTIVVNHYHLYLSIVKNNGAFMVGNKWQISELENMGIKSVRFLSTRHKIYLGIIKKENTAFTAESEKFLRLFKESYGLNKV